MRRLTDFEKKIVATINNSYLDGLDFSNLYYEFYNLNALFRIEHKEINRSGSRVLLYTKKGETPLNKDEQEELEINTRETNKHFFDCLNLIYLLKDNGFIYTDTCGESTKLLYIPPFLSEKFCEIDLNTLSYKKDDSALPVHYNFDGIRDISDESFTLITNTKFIPTAALEIYVLNGFRTEEQKINDKSESHNKITRVVSWLAVGAAVAAVVVSGVFSALSYYDSKAGAAEDKAFKEEMMMHLHKTRNTLEGIKSEMNRKPAILDAKTK